VQLPRQYKPRFSKSKTAADTRLPKVGSKRKPQEVLDQRSLKEFLNKEREAYELEAFRGFEEVGTL
jgi:hypothetical protein